MPVQPRKMFVSYARKDSQFALQLSKDLKSAGADVWVDQLDIRPAQHWDLAIEEALERCPSMLVVLSPTSVKSKNVMDEVSFALEEGKQVIPVLYRTCKVPLRLRRVQYVDFTKDYRSGLVKVLETLGAGAANTEAVPAPAVARPETESPEVQTPRSTAQSHSELLKKAITAGNFDEWNRWRMEHPEVTPNLSAADLHNGDFRNADLSWADLHNADLKGANFTGVDLHNANLAEADLCWANLSRAGLAGTNLRDANLTGADLTGANLNQAGLMGAILEKVTLDDANLGGAYLCQTRALCQEQITGAYGDDRTKLPPELRRPVHWGESHSESEQ